MHNYKELQIWQKAMGTCEDIYSVVRSFPSEEKYGLRNQLTRAAVSIPSNIAEGSGRNSDREFNQFLGIAKGSVFELETQLEICQRLGMIEKEKQEKIHDKLDEIGKMITSLQKSLTSSI